VIDRVILPVHIAAFLDEEAARIPKVETGGILIGFQLDSAFRVTRATGPGPKAVQTAGEFRRDTKYCSAILEEEFRNSGADYIGEWHTHIIPLKHLSVGDIVTSAGIVLDPDYQFKNFLVLLLTKERKRFTPRAFCIYRIEELEAVVLVKEINLEIEREDGKDG
jgi:integrative and conjugative element protein (TIGR02256 family)